MKSSLIHIGKKKACPDFCPVCGITTKVDKGDGSLAALLKGYWGHANKLILRDVDGWPGYKTWYLHCFHMSPIAYMMKQDQCELIGAMSKASQRYSVPVNLSK